jgi:hypothetical protein
MTANNAFERTVRHRGPRLSRHPDRLEHGFRNEKQLHGLPASLEAHHEVIEEFPARHCDRGIRERG